MRTPQINTPGKPDLSALEERVEYSNVTEFRKSLLGMLRKLDENDDLRFIVTRGGEPCAVVLSYDAYELLRRIARRAADASASKDREQRLDEAFLQMAQKEVAGTSAGVCEPLLDENYLQIIIRKSILEGVKHELRRRSANFASPEELAKSDT